VLAIGDHRGDSLDGRYWGLLDERELYGRAIAVYYRSGDVEMRWSAPLQSLKALVGGFTWKAL
jgi:signal peptidase I